MSTDLPATDVDNDPMWVLLGARPVSDGSRHQYVLACQYHPKTYGLGWVQRAIIEHLATAPASFDGGRSWTAEGVLLWHGKPHGITVHALAAAVYNTEMPTENQIRTVQRNVRRLEARELVDCWHVQVNTREAAYVGRLGGRLESMPVSGLAVALRWTCAHIDCPPTS